MTRDTHTTSPAGLAGADDPSIPVLTEQVFPPAAGIGPARPATQPPPAPEAPAAEADAQETQAAGAPEAEPAADVQATDAQGEAVRAAVLRTLTDRLAEQVDCAVRDRLPAAIEEAIARLGEEVKAALRAALPDLVDQALHEERARRQGDAAQD